MKSGASGGEGGEVERLVCELSRAEFLKLAQYRASEGGKIFLSSEDPPSAGALVRLEIRFQGFAQSFAFLGRCITARRKGRGSHFPAGATFDVAKADATGLIKALAFARGEEVAYVEREFPRHPTKLNAKLVVSRKVIPAELRDLSLGGARLTQPQELPNMGEEVGLTIDAADGFFPLKLKGRVMWLCFFEGRRGFGVKFTGGGLGWKHKLEGLVEKAAAGPALIGDHS